MRRLLVGIFAFVVAGAATMLALALLVSLPSGRGFLPHARHFYEIDINLTADDRWVVVRSEQVDGASLSAPSAGLRALIQEESTGGWDPGKLSAWRQRHWTVTHVLDERGQPLAVTSKPNGEAGIPAAAFSVLEDHFDSRIIQASPLWDLWPQDESRVMWPARRTRRDEILLSRSSSSRTHVTGMGAVIVGLGLLAGGVATFLATSASRQPLRSPS